MMADNPHESHDSAEDFASGLEQLPGQLEKSQISKEMQEVRSLLDRGELFEAQRLLLQILNLDPQHDEAVRLLGEVQRGIQQSEINEPMFGPWVQAEKALAVGQFEEARHHAEHALALNPDDTDLRELREILHAEVDRTERLQRILDAAQLAQAEGNLDAAIRAVEEAIEVSPENAEAKALYQLVSRAILERARQRRIENSLRDARQDLSAGKFDRAIEILRRAEELDPNAPGVQSLIQLAVSGRQQDHRQSEIENLSHEIQLELNREDYRSAIQKSDESLMKYPQERALIHLKEQAEVQLQLAENRRIIDSALVAARELFQAGRTQEVREQLEKVLMLLGSEPLLVPPSGALAAQFDRDRKGTESEGQNSSKDASNEQANRVLEAEPSERADVVRTALHMAEQESELGQSKIIIQTALLKLPDDRQLQEKLTQIDRLQELVSRVLDEARSLEEAGQYELALAKWEMIQVIHPRHPELKDALLRIRTLQKHDRGNSREKWINRIEVAISKSEYDEALALVGEAFQEFAWDSDLMELREKTDLALRQRAKAERLLEKSQILLSKQQWQAGAKTLVRAYQVSLQDLFIHDQVVERLTRASSDAMQKDRDAAESILRELKEIEVSRTLTATKPDPQTGSNPVVEENVDMAASGSQAESIESNPGAPPGAVFSAESPGAPRLSPVSREMLVPSGILIDNLRFSVMAPGTIICGEPCEIQVWVHLEQQIETLLERARQARGVDNNYAVKSSQAIPLVRGACLSIRLKLSGCLTCVENHKVVRWTGEIGHATFAVAVPSDVSEADLVGLASIRLNGCQIAKLSFLLNVGSKAPALRTLPCQIVMHRKAFASFDVADREEVLARVQDMESAFKGLKVYVDAAADRSVTYWEPGLHSRIDNADVFYLFWCRHSMVSDWVRREWLWALRSKGMDFIDPVPLEGSEHAPPPAELAPRDFTYLLSGLNKHHP